MAGTTNTGAIDPLHDIADVCSRHGVRLHVDGAYGAVGILDPTYHARLDGIARADTLTVNPHKWLMTPVDCGALLLRDRTAHREAFSLVPAYLEEGGSEEAPWPYHYSFQLTYANRAVKTWATLARLGREGLREIVIRCNRLAERLADAVEAEPDLELMAPVSLSVVCFRYRPTGRAMDDEALDRLQARISERIGESGEAHMPTTQVAGRRCLRACFLHYENDEEDVDHLIGLVKRVAKGAGP
jgi:glutamate/tyrosine decarboxylase-like PLP-dependent enzyme